MFATVRVRQLGSRNLSKEKKNNELNNEFRGIWEFLDVGRSEFGIGDIRSVRKWKNLKER